MIADRTEEDGHDQVVHPFEEPPLRLGRVARFRAEEGVARVRAGRWRAGREVGHRGLRRRRRAAPRKQFRVAALGWVLGRISGATKPGAAA